MTTAKTYLILLAHGSSDPQWQKPFELLTTQIQQAQQHPVTLAYMELCSPSLEAVVAELPKNQAANVEVVPLFFAAGRHLRVDVPRQIEHLSQQYPAFNITLHDPVGLHPVMTEALTRIVGDLNFSDKK